MSRFGVIECVTAGSAARVNILTDAKLIRERDLCHFLRALLRWAKGQQLL
jgi:hypothetical protein